MFTIRGRLSDDVALAAVLTAVATSVSVATGLPREDIWVQWLEVVDSKRSPAGRTSRLRSSSAWLDR